MFLALSSPTRVAIIDALAVRKGMTGKELGSWLVATGDLVEQALPNLSRVHLSQLEDVELIEKFIDDDKTVRYRIGPGLTGGIHWDDIDPNDVELAGAAAEFGRVLTERRISRQRMFESRKWSDFDPAWVGSSTTTDNVECYTRDELEWIANRLEDLSDELAERVSRRRESEPDADERPCFRSFTVFPWGPPDVTSR